MIERNLIKRGTEKTKAHPGKGNRYQTAAGKRRDRNRIGGIGRTMNRSTIYICLAFCISGVFVSILLYHPLARAFGILASIAGVVLLYFFDKSREKLQTLKEQRMEETRTAELIRNIDTTRFLLKVHCPSGICIGLFCFLVGGLVLLPSHHDIPPLIVGAASLLMGILFTVTAIPRIGRPVLELSNFGVATPEYGRIPWSEVDGIDMIENRHRGRILSHTLIFHIPGMARYISQFVAYQRFFFPFRSHAAKQQVRVMIRKADEPPSVILEVSRALLKKGTGHDRPWSSILSALENEAYRRVHDSLKSTDHFIRQIAITAESRDSEALEDLLNTMEDEQKQITRDLKALHKAGDDRHRKELYAMIAMASFFLVYVAWLLWKKF